MSNPLETPEQIDESNAGTEVHGADGVAEQLTAGDTLDPRALGDSLDEGYSPPDREPSVHVPTEAEEEEGASLDELLAAETPEVWDREDTSLFDEEGDEVGTERAGRLIDTDGGLGDLEKDLLAEDVGIDGAGASAEEAAVHIVADDER
ncbi:hypothetical protein JL107_01970 [Nakamurella flavida]|uniref:DUF5709 domain-containing protein n=1 Tax=Nakamurella flavida TaxID=363630 RepID=A0A938YI73_9ACTN|nr:DUF5709 domain-containing protein [Nakamurella flavida]MBM9475203.1 hypothetical protein [Nakamurella flavida]MDP9776776.1 hypothetical protein [Nakamurella flavida]